MFGHLVGRKGDLLLQLHDIRRFVLHFRIIWAQGCFDRVIRNLCVGKLVLKTAEKLKVRIGRIYRKVSRAAIQSALKGRQPRLRVESSAETAESAEASGVERSDVAVDLFLLKHLARLLKIAAQLFDLRSKPAGGLFGGSGLHCDACVNGGS